MSELFDKTLHFLGRAGFKPKIIIIGAMDGVSFDETRGYIDMYGWNELLLVEPVPEMFERLLASYDISRNNQYENSAITETNAPVEMIRIPPAIVDSGQVHCCFNGMSAIYPPRNGLGSEFDRDTVEKYAEKIIVNGITFNTLLSKYKINHFDIMSIDAEGWDWRILQQLNLKLFRPKLIRCEYINLSKEEQQELENYFTNAGYTYIVVGQNIDAVETGFWNLIKG